MYRALSSKCTTYKDNSQTDARYVHLTHYWLILYIWVQNWLLCITNWEHYSHVVIFPMCFNWSNLQLFELRVLCLPALLCAPLFTCRPTFLIYRLQCWNWPKRTGGGGVSCRNVWNFAQGLKFKADFHSKMSVCRHELGGSTPPTPRQFQPWSPVFVLCWKSQDTVLVLTSFLYTRSFIHHINKWY